jgi:hypothetical protein
MDTMVLASHVDNTVASSLVRVTIETLRETVPGAAEIFELKLQEEIERLRAEAALNDDAVAEAAAAALHLSFEGVET